MFETFATGLLNRIIVGAIAAVGMIVQQGPGVPATTSAIQIWNTSKQVMLWMDLGGNLSGSGSATFRGTMEAQLGSGRTLHANDLLRSSGALAIEGGIFQDGLGDCDNAGQKPVYNFATGKFSCGTDDTGTDSADDLSDNDTDDLAEGSNQYFTNERVDDRVNGLLVDGANISTSYSDGSNSLTINGKFGSGNAITIGDARYLRTSTGSLKGFFDTLYFRSSTGSLKAYFDLQYLRTSTGSLKAFFDQQYLRTSTGALKAYFDANYLRTSTGSLEAYFDTQYQSALAFGQGLKITSGLVTLNTTISGSLVRFQTLSGAVIKAKTSLASSGSLIWEGSASGATLWVSTLDGAGLLDCDTAGTSKLLWDATSKRFSCGTDTDTGITTVVAGQGVSVLGTNGVRLNATITGSLVRAPTLSGSDVFAKNSLRSSGSFVWEGSASGANIWTSTLEGAGLTDCDADNQSLSWDATSKRFVCGDDDNTVGSADLTMAFADTRYVGVKGDTMTGGLLIVNTGAGTQAIDTGLLLEVAGSASGRVLHAQDQLRSSGSLVIESVVTLANVPSCTGLQTASNGALSCNNAVYLASSTGSLKTLFDSLYFRSSTGSLKSFFDQQYLRTSTGSLKTLFDANYFRTSTGSLKSLFDLLYFRSSTGALRNSFDGRYVNTFGDTVTGSLVVKGTMTGNHLYAGTLSGAGLVDCDTAGSSKLLWDVTTRRFSCGTDATGGTGNFGSGNVLTILQATDNATSTGHLINTFKNIFLASSTGSLKSFFDANYLRTSTGSLKALFDANYFRTSSGALRTYFNKLYTNVGGDTMTGGLLIVNGGPGTQTIDSNVLLEIAGTASGRVMRAQTTLASSGTLVWETAASGASLWVSTFDGAGLTDCDSDNQSLSWDATSKRFICGDDDNSGGGGMAQADADLRYVQVQGDTMTGALAVQAQISGATLSIGGGAVTIAANGATLFNAGGLAADFRIASEDADNILGIDSVFNDITFGGSSVGAAGAEIYFNMLNNGSTLASAVFNAQGRDADITILGDNDASLFVTDASVDRVGIGTNAPDTKLEVAGTASGAIVRGQSTVASSGSLVWEGTASGAMIRGLGLVDCDTASTSKLLWDTTTGKFLCGTDTDTNSGAWSSTGALVTLANARYVQIPGDTMTGGLLIVAGGAGTQTIDTGLLLEIGGIGSGRILKAMDTLASSGTLIARGATNLQSTLNVLGATTHDLTTTENVMIKNGDSQGSNTGLLTVSGATIFNNHNIGLVSMTVNDDSDSSDTNNALRINVRSNSGDADNVRGLYIPAMGGDTTATSYALVIDSTGWDRSISAAGTIAFTSLGSCTNLQTDSNGVLSCNNAVYLASSTGSLKTLFDGNYFRTSTGSLKTYNDKLYTNMSGDTMTGGLLIVNGGPGTQTIQANVLLEVAGTASGRILRAQDTLASSGTLVWEGSASGASLWVSAFDGAGLVDCDDGTNSKLLWDATSKRFSCGSDQNSGGGGGGAFTSTGSLQTYFNKQYVNVSGDTATGGILIVNGGAGTQAIDAGLLLEVAGTMSGRVIRALNTLTSSGGTILEGTGVIIQRNHVGNNLSTVQTRVNTNAIAIDSPHLEPSVRPGLVWYSSDNNATKPKGGIWLDTTSAGSNMRFGTSNAYATGVTNTGMTLRYDGVLVMEKGAIFNNDEGNNTTTIRSQLFDNAFYFDYAFHVGTDSTDAHILSASGVSALNAINSALLDVRIGAGGDANNLYSDSGNARIGIGTSTPSQKLTVNGDTAILDSSYVLENLTVGDAIITEDADYATLRLTGDSGDDGFKILWADSSNIKWTETFLESTGDLALSHAGGNTFLYFDQANDRIGMFKTNPKAELDVVGTISGSTVRAYSTLASSGALSVEGNANVVGTVTAGDVSCTDCLDFTELSDTMSVDAATTISTHANQIAFVSPGIVLGIDISAGNDVTINGGGNPGYDLLVQGDTDVNLLVSDSTNDRVGIGTSAPDTKLEIIGTASGSMVRGQNTLASSGTLVWEGTASGAMIRGLGLVDCDTAASSKLLWDTTSGTFSCGTDQTSGGISAVGKGLGLSSGLLTLNATLTGTTLRGWTTISGATLYAGPGAVGTPSYTFGGDQNTGLYWISADTLGIATAGVERMRFDSVGRIGIDKTPGTTLDMSGALTISRAVGQSTGAMLIVDTKGLVYDGTTDRVGIGTDAPKAMLSVTGTMSGKFVQVFGSGATPLLWANGGRVGVGTANVPSTNTLQVGTPGTSTQMAVNKWELRDDNSNVAFENKNAGAFLMYNTVGSADTSLGFRFHVTSSQTAAMDILNNGNVGIGKTPASNTRLHVYEAGSSTAQWRGRIIAGGDSVAFLMGERNSLAWLGAHNAALGAWSDFYLNPDGNNTLFLGDSNDAGETPTPIITIANGGNENVGINTTTPEAGVALEVIGTISGSTLSSRSLRNCDTTDTNASGVLACGTDASDFRLKKDIKPIGDGALDFLNTVRTVTFKWNDTMLQMYPDVADDGTQIGFIAQDFIEMFPQLVDEKEDGYLRLDYDRITPLLVKAMQELDKKVEEQERRIDRLEAIIERNHLE